MNPRSHLHARIIPRTLLGLMTLAGDRVRATSAMDTRHGFSKVNSRHSFPAETNTYAARHTGCGVQIRPRPIPASPFIPLPHSEHAAPLHPIPAETELPACGGINPHFPTLLSDIVLFFGAGLCWGLEKTHSAANLPMVEGDVTRGARGALGRGRFGSTPGRGANGAAMGTDVHALHGSPRPALLLVEHVLEIDSGTIPPASMSQVFFNK